MVTNKLHTPPIVFPNLIGNPINALNNLKQVLKTVAFTSLESGAIATALAANEARYSNIEDEPDIVDYNKAYGVYFKNMPNYGQLELGNVDPSAGNDYTGIDGNTYTFSNIVFPAALVTAQQPKRIVKTQIQGRDGAIKEYIGMNDWNITINAVVTMPANIAPIDFLNAMNKMLVAPVPIPVTNYYLNNLNIHWVVIEDIQLNQVEGEYSAQSVNITCCSDIPLENFLP